MSGFFTAGRVLALGAILICLGLGLAGCGHRGNEGPLLTNILKGA